MKRWPAAFLLLCGVVFLAHLSYEWCRHPITSLFALSFGIDKSFIGFIAGASTVTGILLKFPAGIFSDVFGRRPVLLVGLVFFAVPPFLYPLAHSPWVLLAIRFTHGCATAIYSPVAQAIVADLFKERRAAAMGWYTACGLTGRSSGSAVSPFLLGATGSFATTYLLAGPVGVSALLLAMWLRPPKVETTDAPAKRRARFVTGLKEAVSDIRVIFTSVMEAVVMTATGALQAFLPIYAIEVRGLKPQHVGILFAAQLVTSLLSRPIMGMISDRVGRRPMIVTGMLGTATAFMLIARAEAFPVMLVLSALYGFSEAIIHTSTNTFVADICKQRSLGSAMGIFGTIMDIGHAAGPIGAGALLIALHDNYSLTFVIIGSAVVACALLFLAIVRNPAPPAEPAPS